MVGLLPISEAGSRHGFGVKPGREQACSRLHMTGRDMVWLACRGERQRCACAQPGSSWPQVATYILVSQHGCG